MTMEHVQGQTLTFPLQTSSASQGRVCTAIA